MLQSHHTRVFFSLKIQRDLKMRNSIYLFLWVFRTMFIFVRNKSILENEKRSNKLVTQLRKPWETLEPCANDSLLQTS